MTKSKSVTVYDRIYMHLFDDKEKTVLSEDDYRVKLRIQAGFTKKLDLPTITDRAMVKFLCETFNISQAQAYIDINAIEMVYGNVHKANKESIRTMITETQKTVINLELKRIKDVEEYNQKQTVDKRIHYSTQNLIAALNVMAKANNLDKENPETPNWEDIQPPIIEPTNDVTTVDLDPIPEGTITLLKQRYMGKMKQIQDRDNE
ncbi:MAG: hypothetical protein EOL88_02460 [Bacteroidia bacterium]|nr:hypothetical protein [Bacteroidia bacterium]